MLANAPKMLDLIVKYFVPKEYAAKKKEDCNKFDNKEQDNHSTLDCTIKDYDTNA